MADQDVKQLLLQVDAAVELLRRNLAQGSQVVDRFVGDTERRLDQADRRFERFGKPLTGISATVGQVNAKIATIGNSVESVERRMRASSEGIRAALLASTAGIAAAFSANQIKEFADEYTRYTNQLKIAGLEGSNLAKVQDELFAVAQRNGAPLEAIGTLYGRAAQAGKSLGASQSDLVKFTGAVGAALKIQGGSAEEARGALLQLSQALGSGTVHAEEFNSVGEGLRPILAAAAEASDKYRGNISLLKADVVAQKVTSQDLFRLILAGYDSLETKASRANLTIGASFTVLNNAIGRQIGLSDQSLSATQRVSAGIVGLANNVDTIIPALATVAVSYGVLKTGQLAWAGATSVAAVALKTEQGLLAETAKAYAAGSASLINQTELKAKAAAAAEAAAVAEVEAIEVTVAALRQEAAQLETNLALIQAQRLEAQQSQAAIAESMALGFGTLGQGGQTRSGSQIDAGRALKAEIATKAALIETNAALAASETELAAATVASEAATVASTEASKAATISARLTAAATNLLAGSMNLLLGALPIVAIGALVAVIMHMRAAAEATEAQIRSFDERQRAAAETLRLTSIYGAQASGGIRQAGAAAVAATPGMLSFAGAVGEAAEKLRQLSLQRRNEALSKLQTDANDASKSISEAQGRIDSRKRRDDQVRGGGFSEAVSTDPLADTVDREKIRAANVTLAAARREYQRIRGLRPEELLSESERNGGTDVKGDLARARNDLKIAQAGTDKREINRLNARVYELTQYQGYRKQGFSDDSAKSQAATDASRLREAADAKLSAADAKRAARGVATGKRKEEAEVKDAAADARAYAAASRSADNDIARAKADLSNSAEERARLEKNRIDAEKANRDEEIAAQGPGGLKRYSGDQVKDLQAKNAERARLEKSKVDADLLASQHRDQLELAQARSDNERDLLSAQAGLVFSAKARRAIELRLLELSYQEEKLKLEAIRDSTDASVSANQKKIAKERLTALDDKHVLDVEGVRRQNTGPFDAYRLNLQKNVGDINEALDGVKADAFQGLEDGILGVINGTESVADAFKKMASSIIADLARIAIEKAILSAVGLPFGFSGGGKVEGFAAGGLPRYAGGGKIVGPGTGTSDSILALVGKKPIRVANGEFIMNARATADNLGLLTAMNEGRIPRFAEGGLTSAIRVPRITNAEMRMVGARNGAGSRLGSVIIDMRGTMTTEQQIARLQAEMTRIAQGAVTVATEHTNELFRLAARDPL